MTELMETGSNDVLVVEANVKDAFGMKGAVDTVPGRAGDQEY